MSNGVYRQVKRILDDPHTSDEVRDKMLAELWLDMHQMIQGMENDVRRNREHLNRLREYPSLHQRFVESPIKTTTFILIMFSLFELIATLVPEFLKYLLALL